MKSSSTIALILVFVLTAHSLGVALAGVSKDKLNPTASMNKSNTTKNLTNTTSLNVTIAANAQNTAANITKPLNTTKIFDISTEMQGTSSTPKYSEIAELANLLDA